MATLLWDASALVKRYAPETGSDAADALFAAVPAPRMVATVLGYAETYSAVLRKYHRGGIGPAAFAKAKNSLRTEVVDDPAFGLLTVDDAAIFTGVALMEQYRVNASDAAILAVFLRYVQALPPGSPAAVLVAADQRLLSAAQAHRLRTLNPELVPAGDIPTFLAAL